MTATLLWQIIGVNEVTLRKIQEISLEYIQLLTASPKLGCSSRRDVDGGDFHYMSYILPSVTYACRLK